MTLVERLRHGAKYDFAYDVADDMLEAATRIEELERGIANVTAERDDVKRALADWLVGNRPDELDHQVADCVKRLSVEPLTGALPGGWKLVPIHPTPEMTKAALGPHATGATNRQQIWGAWNAMLDAAPAAPRVEPLHDEERFTCPECGGHFWGTAQAAKREDWEGHCNGWVSAVPPRRCNFRWKRTDDSLYFGPVVSPEERR